jgi:hypothetical protein
MANYKEQSEAGQSWQRAHHVAINNRFGELPVVTFAEETAAILSGAGFFAKPAGAITKQIANFGESFPLINPLTGEPTGQSMSYFEMQQAIYSAYIYEAAKRDAALLVEPANSV